MPTNTPNVWRAGSAALKRIDNPDAAEWVCALLKDRDGSPRFRLPCPIAAGDGRWIVDGWTASTWLSGEEDGSNWHQIIKAGDLLHEWLAKVERPAWIDQIDDPWRRADRAAWGEQPVEVRAEFVPLTEELTSMRRPVSQDSQLVHGDLTGNVLFSEGLPPGIIDLSLYWRPPGYAAGIVAVDCYEWGGIGPEVLDEVARLPDGEQLLIRAALFRLVRAAMVNWADPEPKLDVHRRTVSSIRSMIG